MGSDVTQTSYRAILVPSPHVTDAGFSEADSGYTQAGPGPGDAVPQNDSDMVLQTSGTQSASKALRIQAQRGGHPGADRAQFVWKNDGDAAWRGWDAPSVMTGWEALKWIDTGTSSDTSKDPYIFGLQSGGLLVAYEEFKNSSSEYRIRVARRNTDGTWSTVSATTATAAQTFGWLPTFAQLPSGRVLLFACLNDAAVGICQIGLWYSDDDGATWAESTRRALKEGIDTASVPGAGNSGSDPLRLRAAYQGGEVLLLAEVRAHSTTVGVAYRDGLVQFASDDLGNSFVTVDYWEPVRFASMASKMDIQPTSSGFLVVGLPDNPNAGASTDLPQARRLGSAFDVLRHQTAADVPIPEKPATDAFPYDLTGTPATVDEGEIALWRDEAGAFYVAGLHREAAEANLTRGWVSRSTDEGLTWTPLGRGSYTALLGEKGGFWFEQDDAGTYLTNISAAFHQGRAVLAHKWTATASATATYSIGLASLGGYGTTTMPAYQSSATEAQRVVWGRTWIPIDLPANVQWTKSGTGAEALATGGLELSSAPSVTYTQNPPGTVAEGLLVRVEFAVSTGGSTTTLEPGMEIRLADSVADYQVSIRASTTGWALWDDNGPAQVGSTVTMDMTAGADIIVGVDAGNVATWYRARSPSPDREFIVGPSSASLTNDSGAADPNNKIKWGNHGGAVVGSKWWGLFHVSDQWAGGALAGGQKNPGGLWGRALGGEPVTVDGGVKITALDGPAFRGEVWHIDTRYDHPVRAVLPSVSPSPDEQWRSASAATQTLAWTFDEVIPMNTTVGLYLAGCNWKSGKFQGLYSGAWEQLAGIELAQDRSALPFTRQGSTVRPSATAHTAEHYIEENELAGHTIDLGSGILRRVVSNTAGLWTNATTKTPVLYLGGVLGGDPASGTASIWSTSGLLVVHNVLKDYEGFRIVVSTTTTVDNDIRIGAAAMGPIYIFGNDTSWGRTLDIEPQVELVTTRSGTRRAKTLGKPRRGMEVAWADGIDAKPVQGTTPDPDHLKTTTTAAALPMALRGEAMLVRDLMRDIGGAAQPVVYIPNLKRGTPDSYMEIRRSEALYGRVMGGVRLEQVQGTENEDEVFRIASIRIEEEL
jgi:hypothetical protein